MTMEDATGRKMDTRMKQQLKTAWVAAPVIASITQTGKHSKTTEGVERKEKSTISLATITIVAKKLYHISYLCVKNLAMIVILNGQYNVV